MWLKRLWLWKNNWETHIDILIVRQITRKSFTRSQCWRCVIILNLNFFIDSDSHVRERLSRTHAKASSRESKQREIANTKCNSKKSRHGTDNVVYSVLMQWKFPIVNNFLLVFSIYFPTDDDDEKSTFVILILDKYIFLPSYRGFKSFYANVVCSRRLNAKISREYKME